MAPNVRIFKIYFFIKASKKHKFVISFVLPQTAKLLKKCKRWIVKFTFRQAVENHARLKIPRQLQPVIISLGDNFIR